MSICARPECLNEGVSGCSICLREHSRSGDCQKGDWEAHKSICKCLKKLSLHLQLYHEVHRVIEEIHEGILESKNFKNLEY